MSLILVLLFFFFGLQDVLSAIKLRHGGMHVVARKLGLRISTPSVRAARNEYVGRIH